MVIFFLDTPEFKMSVVCYSSIPLQSAVVWGVIMITGKWITACAHQYVSPQPPFLRSFTGQEI